MARITTLILTLLSVALACSAKLVVYEAGWSWRRGPVLRPGLIFCPWRFSPRGFTVQCKLPFVVPGGVDFYVNNKFVRHEAVPPYTIAGDSRGFQFRWRHFPKTAYIVCQWRNKWGQYRARRAYVHFKCFPKPAPRPWRKPKKTWKKPRKGRYRPWRKPRKSWKPWRPKPKPWRKPWKPKPKPWRPKPRPWRKPWKPKPKPWRPKPKPWRKPWRPKGKGLCVIIPSWKNAGLNKGWKYAKGGLSYKPYDNYGGVVPGNTSPISFYFKVPVRAKYAVTLDMYAPHWTEHNDVWLKFPYKNGFTLRRFGRARYGGTGYLKAYHNRAKRVTQAFSIDFNPHTFSTSNVLHPGVTYKIIVGARSTKVVLYNIVMFPCKGKQCEASNGHWRYYVHTCK